MVADAVGREHDHIGLTGEAGKQVQMVLHAAVVVQEIGARIFGDGPEVRHVMRPATDIEQRDTIEPGTVTARQRHCRRGLRASMSRRPPVPAGARCSRVRRSPVRNAPRRWRSWRWPAAHPAQRCAASLLSRRRWRSATNWCSVALWSPGADGSAATCWASARRSS